MNAKSMLITGAALACLAVTLGAFGAHALRVQLPIWYGNLDRLETWETGVRYQLFHALGLLGLAAIQLIRPSKVFAVSAWLITIGCLIFSGSLYAIVLSGISVFGAITPIGGSLLILGWLLIVVGASRMESTRLPQDSFN
jgi:uncharacterized membrane protein YgdD (TMEM256/DUF423 family)